MFVAVQQRVERQVVQEIVRRDDQVLRLQILRDRRDELVVELLQMRVGRLQQLRVERLHVIPAQPEFGELKAEQLQ